MLLRIVSFLSLLACSLRLFVLEMHAGKTCYFEVYHWPIVLPALRFGSTDGVIRCILPCYFVYVVVLTTKNWLVRLVAQGFFLHAVLVFFISSLPSSLHSFLPSFHGFGAGRDGSTTLRELLAAPRVPFREEVNVPRRGEVGASYILGSRRRRRRGRSY